MTPEERNELKLRWLECEQQIQAIHAGQVVRDGSPAEVEAPVARRAGHHRIRAWAGRYAAFSRC